MSTLGTAPGIAAASRHAESGGLPQRKPGWQIALVVLFLTVLLLPNLDLAFGLDPNPSATRDTVEFPKLSSSRPLSRLPGELMWYLKSSMGFRKTLVRARGLFAYHWLGVSPSPGSVILSNQWLFLKSERVPEDFRRIDPFSPAQLDRWRAVLEARRAWLESHQIRYLVVIAPNKETVYPESLSSFMTRREGPSRLEQLVGHLRAVSKVQVLDLTSAMLSAKAKARVYHYTDTHWNDLGAFSAYRELMTRLTSWFPALHILDWNDVRRREEKTPGGDLARMCGLKLDLLEPQVELDLAPNISRARFDGGAPLAFERMDVRGSPRFVTRSVGGEIPSAIVLRDSFGEALIPYLARHVEKATWIWTYDFPADVIDKERPTLVIQQLVERKLMVIEPSNPPELTSTSGFR